MRKITPAPTEPVICPASLLTGQPVGYQRWNHLLFLHWPVPPALVQATLPRGLQVDTFGGDAYVGIVPFAMERGVRRLSVSIPLGFGRVR